MTAVPDDGYEIWSVDGKPVSIHFRSGSAQFAATPISFLTRDPPSKTEASFGAASATPVKTTTSSPSSKATSLIASMSEEKGWALSECDRRRLKKRLRQKNGDLQPVGYWRSHRRLGLYLDKRDADLMATYFAEPWAVALCVRPPSTAGSFFGRKAIFAGPAATGNSDFPCSPQTPLLLQSLPPRRTAAATAAVVAALAVTPLYIKSKATSGSPFNMLSMRAETKPGLVRLRWNPRSKVLSDAQGAVIWIADGPEESKLELTPEQVQSGSIEYKPAGSDVNFRMQVGQFTESIRIQHALSGRCSCPTSRSSAS